MDREPLLRPTTRRGFLAGAAALAVAAACGDDGNGSDGTGAGATTTVNQAELDIQGSLATNDLWAGPELRVPFGVLERVEGGFAEIAGAPVSVGFTGLDGGRIAPARATFRNEGLPKELHEGIYTVQATFPNPGFWEAHLDVAGREGRFTFEVLDAPLNRAVSQDAVATPSPTPDNPLGVDPICTLDPECGLHGVSLDDAMAGDRPVALMFATPARCQSRWCGPVLQVLLTEVPNYEDRITFVHVEIYKDLESNESVPTVAEWNLATEPLLYGIDPGGTIVSRLDGAFDITELRGLLDGLAATA